MKEVIIHGIPDPEYFLIAVPTAYAYKPMDGEGPIIELEDPKTHARRKVQIVDTLTYEIEDFVKIGTLSLLAYSMPAPKIAHILKLKYPEIEATNLIRYLVLKKI